MSLNKSKSTRMVFSKCHHTFKDMMKPISVSISFRLPDRFQYTVKTRSHAAEIIHLQDFLYFKVAINCSCSYFGILCNHWHRCCIKPLLQTAEAKQKKIAFCFVGVDSTLSPLSKNGMKRSFRYNYKYKKRILIVKR